MPRMAGFLGLVAFISVGCLSAPMILPPDNMPIYVTPAPAVTVAPDVRSGNGDTIPVSNLTGGLVGDFPQSIDGAREAALPKLGEIYVRSAQSVDTERNPLIVIPGVLGSRLVDDNTQRVVWGEFGGDGIDPSSPAGARLLALPMAEGKGLWELTDSVHVQGVLETLEIRVFGVPFEMSAYRDILVALGVGGYHESSQGNGDPHTGHNHNSFQFAFDWRRDNVENAQRLHQFILGKKAEIEAERRQRLGDAAPPVKFDIVAHSMGGLIARYYLYYGDADLPADGTTPKLTWAGAQNVDRVVLVGTPNAGSIDAVENMINGVVFSQALPRYQAAILGTMPGLYQLLPRSRHRPVLNDVDRRPVDTMDPQSWLRYQWGLLNPSQQQVLRQLLPNVPDPAIQQRIAFDHVKKCLDRASAFQTALDVRAKSPPGTTIHLIAGDAHATSAQLWVRPDGSISVASKLPGDGKVTRASALMDERYANGAKWSPRLVTPIGWSSVNFLFTDHLGLTRDPAFTDNVLFLLLEAPRD